MPMRLIPASLDAPPSASKNFGRSARAREESAIGRPLDIDAVLGRAAPDRLTLLVAVVLLLPAVLFLVGWARAWAVPAAAAGVLSLVLSPGWRSAWPLSPGRTFVCLALGLVWAMATGAHHLVYSTADWQIRDAVLRDLSAGPWPVAYRHAEDGTEWLLRAPLGFFLPAGLVGQVAGFGAARAALTAWAGIGFALVLMLLSVLAQSVAPRTRGGFAVFAAVFLLFGGLDLLPNMWLDARFGSGPFAAWGRGGEWWNRFFQYAGHVTGTLWAPNHALPAWLITVLVLRHGGRPEFLRGVAVPLVGAAFWSPVAAAGAAVFVGLAALRQGGRQGWRAVLAAMASPANLLVVVLAVPVILYLLAGSAAVPHGFLLSVRPPAEALARWALLLAVEVLPWAAAAAFLVRGWTLTAAVAMLALLPAYVFGPGNEMTSRGGMAPLAVLAVASAAALLAPAPDRARRLARGALVAVTIIAAGGAAMEGSLLIAKRPWAPSDHCSLPEAARESVFDDSTDWAHYVLEAPFPPTLSWMRDTLRRPVPPQGASPPCWTGGRP